MIPARSSILLVDDSPDTLEMYALGLSFAGYDPLTATDTHSALLQLETDHPNAVVTDLQLVGGRNGWELIDAIRNDPSMRGIPIVVLTGGIDSSIARTAARAGCAAILIKPCLPEQLAEVLRAVI